MCHVFCPSCACDYPSCSVLHLWHFVHLIDRYTFQESISIIQSIYHYLRASILKRCLILPMCPIYGKMWAWMVMVMCCSEVSVELYMTHIYSTQQCGWLNSSISEGDWGDGGRVPRVRVDNDLWLVSIYFELVSPHPRLHISDTGLYGSDNTARSMLLWRSESQIESQLCQCHCPRQWLKVY